MKHSLKKTDNCTNIMYANIALMKYEIEVENLLLIHVPFRKIYV